MSSLKTSSVKMYEAVSENGSSVVFATVSGFVEKKYKYWLTPDYFFIVEVFWSNKQTTYVKRNYADFVQFHKDLTRHFKAKYEKGTIKTHVFIPALNGRALFKLNSVELAESRELEVQEFLKQLIQGNPLVSGTNIVQDFFTTRPSDPVSCSDTLPVGDDDDEDHVLFDR